MAQIKNHPFNSKRVALLAFLSFCFFLQSCNMGLADTNVQIPERRWAYRNHVTAAVEIKDVSKAYNIRFKLRHTADYKYSNIYILAHFREGKNVVTRRYQFKLAKNDGEWLGSGSGNLFSYSLPLLTGYRFSKAGKFTIDIEQNMRDNPLTEISDAGISVEEAVN